ncbi:MAG: right-handed parallel beta-helix repeat-containing protein, partial [Anaerolineae bacterium]|nr:right-handed parallel beta-helix repeat-containing protein [Anaerolineae bacterium]
MSRQKSVYWIISILFVFAGLLLFFFGLGTRSMAASIEDLPHPVLRAPQAAIRYVAPDCAGKPAPCYTSVQSAVDVATSGDEIHVATGVYTGVQARSGITQVVFIDRSLILRGGYNLDFSAWNPALYTTTLDARGLGRAAVISGPVTVTFTGLHLTGGRANGLGGSHIYDTSNCGGACDAGAGVYALHAALILSETTFYSNTILGCSQASGAGVYIYSGSLSIFDSVLFYNQMGGAYINAVRGGAIGAFNSDVLLHNTTLEANAASGGSGGSDTGEGGGLYADGGSLLIASSVISGNRSGVGGGVYAKDGTVAFQDNVFARNYRASGAGAYIATSGAVISGNTFIDNDPEQNWHILGGGLRVEGDAVSIKNNTFTGNHASDGAGLAVRGENLIISQNRVVNNSGTWDSVSGDGGGLYLGGSGLVASNIITGNFCPDGEYQAYGNGGGVYVDYNSAFTFTQNLISGNLVYGSGGGMYVYDGSRVYMENNVLVDNYAWGEGTGVYINDATLDGLHNTFARNTGRDGQQSAVYAYWNSRVTLRNSIVSSHTTGIYTSLWDGGTLNVEGVLWHNNGTDITGTVAGSTHNVYGDPLFAADGYHLQMGSPAEGNALHTDGFWEDLEGDPRPAGTGYDLGADEITGTALQLVVTPSEIRLAHSRTVTYMMVITVTGGNATALVLTDTLPIQQRPVNVASSYGTCDLVGNYGGGATCALGNLSAGARVWVTLTAQMTPTPPAIADMPLPITNTLTARSAESRYTLTTPLLFQYCFANLNGMVYSVLQEAVDAAGDGDLIKVAGYCDTLNASGKEIVYITKTLTLQGGYSANFLAWDPTVYTTTLDPHFLGRAIVVEGVGVRPTIAGFYITHGNARNSRVNSNMGGGIYILRASPIVQNNIIAYNYGSYDPENPSTNITGWGGGITVDREEADPIIRNNLIQYNTAEKGGGLLTWECDETDTRVRIEGNTFYSNTATTGSGGGALIGRCDADVVGNIFRDNYTCYDGGGARIEADYWQGGAGVTFDGNRVENNIAENNGGGISLDSSLRLEMEDNQIRHNTAANGNGGGLMYAGSYDISLYLRRNVISLNTAADCGGGAYFGSGASGTLEGNRVEGNTAPRSGGGMYLNDGLTLNNNVIINNTGGDATYPGSGVYVHTGGYSNAPWLHNTIGNNMGSGEGIYIYAWNSPVYMTNTLIYSQTVGVGNADGGNPVLLYSTLWDSVITSTVGLITDTGSLVGGAVLASDGYHLGAASAARDAGVATTLSDDVDNQPRPMGTAPDIGADEVAYYADLSLSKARVESGPVQGGKPITYVLTLASSAASELQADALLVDCPEPAWAVDGIAGIVPGGTCVSSGAALTCTLANLPTTTLTLATVWVTPTALYDGVLTNTASITPTDAVDPAPENNIAAPLTATVVLPLPDLWVVKTAPRYTRPGGTLVYNLTWSNAGSVAADPVVLTDTLPAQVTFISATGDYIRDGQQLTWTLGETASGAGGAYTVTVQVGNGLSDGTCLVNTAGITGDTAEAVTTNNRAVFTTTVYQLGGFDLELDKAVSSLPDGPAEAEVGATIAYEIRVKNTGQERARVNVTDTLPEAVEYVPGSAWATRSFVLVSGTQLSWQAWLEPDQTATIHFEVKIISCDGVTCGQLRNTARASVEGLAYVWEASVDTTVRCPDMTVSVSAPQHVALGEDEMFDGYWATLTWRNAAAHAAAGVGHNVTLDVTLPQSAIFADADPLPGNCVDDQHCMWALGEQPAGAQGVVRVLVWPKVWSDAGYQLDAKITAYPSEECAANLSNESRATTWPAGMILDKYAAPLRVTTMPGSQNLRFVQDYVIDYRYRNANPDRPALSGYTLTEEWPGVLRLDTQLSEPGLTFDGDPTWSGSYGLYPGSRGWLRISGSAPAYSLASGQTLRNRIHIEGQIVTETLKSSAAVTSTVPAIPPLITYPGDGEICPGPVEVRGLAQSGAQVRIYVNDVYRTSTTAGAQGNFATTVEIPDAGYYTIHAVAQVGLVVNSADDAPDKDVNDGICDTGYTITRNGEEVAECTLRAAIQQANALAGADIITFDVPGTGIPTLSPESALPSMTGPTIVDATTQPESHRVTLDGLLTGAGVHGLNVIADDVTIQGLEIVWFAHGILLESANRARITNNIIRDNVLTGITVLSGSGNTFSANIIAQNNGLGIDLGGDGVTPNDLFDGDSGPNELQNMPQLTSLVGEQSLVRGVLNAQPHTTYRIEFFANDVCDASGYGEGQRYLGTSTATTGSDGLAQFEFATTAHRSAGLSLTATDPQGNTSEFSRCRRVEVKDVTSQQQNVADKQWVALPSSDGIYSTVDGNQVRLSAEVVNHEKYPEKVRVEFRDAQTGVVLPGGIILQTVYAEYPQRVEYTWDTTGAAWSAVRVPRLTPYRILVSIYSTESGASQSLIAEREIAISIRPRPVILVHGWRSSAIAAWSTYPDFLHAYHPNWEGYAIETMRTGDFVEFGYSISENARRLDNYIQGVREWENAWHVDIVAHSKGGLISRQYIHSFMREKTPDNKPIVTHLVMLGTPNLGSTLAYPAGYGNGRLELRPDYLQTFNAWVTNRRDVPFSVLAGNLDILYSCLRSPSYPLLFSSRCDWVVAVESAVGWDGEYDPIARTWYGRPYPSVYIDDYQLYKIGHTSMTESRALFDAFVLPRLSSVPAQEVREVAHTDEGTDVAETVVPQFILVETVPLAANDNVVIPFSVGDGLTLTVSIAGPESVSVTLHAPSGDVPWSVATGTVQARQPFRAFSTVAPAAGEWQIVLENTVSEVITTFVAAEVAGSAAAFDLVVSAPDTQNRITFSTTLMDGGSPVAGATVTAELYGTDGGIITLPLYDDGTHGDGVTNDGVYAALSTSLPLDDYQIMARAQTATRSLATTRITRIAEADLSLGQFATPDPATAGQPLTYTVVVTNYGPSDAPNVVITDTLPAGTLLLAAEASRGGCEGVGEFVTCTLGLLSGEYATATLVMIPTTAGPLTHTARITSDARDPVS